MRLVEANALAKKGEVVTVPVPPQATEAGVAVTASSELRAGIAVAMQEPQHKSGPL